MRDAGNLLTRAGFTLPGVDVDGYTVQYHSGNFFCLIVDKYTVRTNEQMLHFK